MKILLIEDDVTECKCYKEICKKRDDVEIVATTNSSLEAIQLVQSYKPDGVILDLELTDGEGSGIDFIENIKKIPISKKPKIVVTTNVYSNTIYDFCHKNKIDFVFYKKQKNFSRENVIKTLKLLSEYTEEKSVVEKIEENDVKHEILYKINKELDLIGVAIHLQGRKYLIDAIEFVIENEGNMKTSIMPYLVNKYKKSNSTISRAMQNAILHAWRVSPLEDLTVHYTARINYETGVPTPMEFIYYYANKIKKEL